MIPFDPALRAEVEALAAQGLRPHEILTRFEGVFKRKQIEQMVWRWRRRVGKPQPAGASGSPDWTDEQVDALKSMWPSGLSGSAIAAEIGGGLTRCAVLGKARRLGLSKRESPHKPSKPPAPRSRTSGALSGLRSAVSAYVGKGQAAMAKRAAANRDEAVRKLSLHTQINAPPIELQQSQRVTLMELRSGMCKWPLGDPVNQPDEFRYCGAPWMGTGNLLIAADMRRLHTGRAARACRRNTKPRSPRWRRSDMRCGARLMLTKRQSDLLRFIHERLKETGVSPSFDEMKNALDLRSKSGIHRLILALEERGFIRHLPAHARAIEIVKGDGDAERRASALKAELDSLKSELAKAAQRERRLREALLPFAQAAGLATAGMDDKFTILLHLGDCRRAQEAARMGRAE